MMRGWHPLRRRGPGRADASRAGFLLVEALAAMAIGAFILVALVSTVALVTRASGRTADLSSELEATTRAMSAMARDLKVAARVRWAGADAPFVFAGTPTRLVFARRFEAFGDLRLIALSAQDAPRPHVLRSSSLFPPTAAGPGDLTAESLAEAYAGTLAVRFAYFSPLPSGEEALVDTWDVGSEMPSAVRIAMFDPRTGDIVSSLRVPLMIDAEPGCAAPSTALCSYVVNGRADAVGADDLPPEPINPDDARGWLSYAR